MSLIGINNVDEWRMLRIQLAGHNVTMSFENDLVLGSLNHQKRASKVFRYKHRRDRAQCWITWVADHFAQEDLAFRVGIFDEGCDVTRP